MLCCDLISFTLFSTNVFKGLLLSIQCSTHWESNHICLCVISRFSSVSTNFKHLLQMRAARSSNLGITSHLILLTALYAYSIRSSNIWLNSYNDITTLLNVDVVAKVKLR